MSATIRLTMAQALVRYLCNQFTAMDGVKVPLFPGVFAIFGHGNVTCRAEAREAVQDVLPTGQGKTSNRWRWRPSALPRPGDGLGQNHRSHHPHHYGLGRLYLDAGRCLVGCRRPIDERKERSARGT